MTTVWGESRLGWCPGDGNRSNTIQAESVSQYAWKTSVVSEPEFKSWPARLVRLFRRSREIWKQRAGQAAGVEGTSHHRPGSLRKP